MIHIFPSFSSLPQPLQILIIIVLLLILLFELYMFIHVLKNMYLSTNAKILWDIGMLLLHPFVAIIYFFTDYKKKSSK